MYTLTAQPATVDIKQEITVEWDAAEEPTTSDWIGMYLVGSKNNDYTMWNWVTKTGANKVVVFILPINAIIPLPYL